MRLRIQITVHSWLAARNEGRLKTYESCVDVRAWSHDIRTRNYHLRDWIKRDMPICVLPVCTLASILTVMTCRSGRAGPRCHQGCQSKVLLASICSSCTAIRDCLRNSKDFEKYFEEEEFETVHWPCTRCLEILKSIKMFWKIVVEKVIQMHIPKNNEFDDNNIKKHYSKHSILNIADEWQKEMVQEAIFVTSNSLLLKQDSIIKRTSSAVSNNTLRISEREECIYYDIQNKATETDYEFRSIAVQTDRRSVRQICKYEVCKCTSASIKVAKLECDSCNEKNNEVNVLYKNNIQNLQQQCNWQQREVDRLKKENITLNLELQRVHQKQVKKSFHNDTFVNTIDNAVPVDATPSENNPDDGPELNLAKNIDSEIIITLKNCKNENFRHVSMLQVLHKTNEQNFPGTNCSHFQKEDPIHLLNKVQEKFGAIVNREISIVNNTDKKSKDKDVMIKTSFKNIDDCRLDPPSSTFAFSLTSNFESAKEIYDGSIKSGV